MDQVNSALVKILSRFNDQVFFVTHSEIQRLILTNNIRVYNIVDSAMTKSLHVWSSRVVWDGMVTWYFTASNSFSDCKRGPKKDHLRGLKCNPDPWKMAKKWAREAKGRSANELVKCKKRWWQHFFSSEIGGREQNTTLCQSLEPKMHNQPPQALGSM